MAEIRVQVNEETMNDFSFICEQTGATPEQVLRVVLDDMREQVRRGLGMFDVLVDTVEEEEE